MTQELIQKSNFKDFLQSCFHEVYPQKTFYKEKYINVLLDTLECVTKNSLKKNNKKYSKKESNNLNNLNRVIINLPPRCMKSFIITISWTAWLLGIDPTIQLIVASYSNALSIKHSIDTRNIILSHWYKKLFPNTILSHEQNTKIKFKTTQHGFRLATSVGAYITGEGADILIADDPISPSQINSFKLREKNISWFENTFLTRLNNFAKSSVIVVMHRLHEDDLINHLSTKKSAEEISIWKVISFPFISEKDTYFYSQINKNKLLCTLKKGEVLLKSMYSEKDIDFLKYNVGSHTFRTQYQQNPVSLKNSLLKYEWVMRYKSIHIKEYESGNIIMSCDTASSNTGDYNAIVKILSINNKYYIIDVVRIQCSYIDFKNLLINICNKESPNTLIIENKSSGSMLIEEIKNKCPHVPTIKFTPKECKMTRFLQTLSFFEAGDIFFPYNANWLADFENEIFLFPNTQNDDQVDALSQFFLWLKNKKNNVVSTRML